eukprot:NODE_3213_length_963_cov_10.553611_g2670_i0.p4 GENE.NODE_3213_length_963_cov_10.553611_g2670_i0~~NODE_3213_length_963_cov_10.553611_g2670_i0.p4  ORF type:complete len:61 (-),score=6.91 NODE_3213_length_963_cov_10.553611_g2670_i0:458-640(-)
MVRNDGRVWGGITSPPDPSPDDSGREKPMAAPYQSRLGSDLAQKGQIFPNLTLLGQISSP